jgi:hypothetical protein
MRSAAVTTLMRPSSLMFCSKLQLASRTADRNADWRKSRRCSGTTSTWEGLGRFLAGRFWRDLTAAQQDEF